MIRWRKLAFLGIIGLQLLTLASMIGQRIHLLRTGQTALLRCQPLDPRSFLSGDYVRLSFAISRLSSEQVKALSIDTQSFAEQETIYLALERRADDPHHQAIALSHSLPKLKQRWPLVIRGTVELVYWGGIMIRYGVEEYFVPQDQGRPIERQMDRAAVEVAVSSSGESAIRRLLVAGREVTFY